MERTLEIDIVDGYKDLLLLFQKQTTLHHELTNQLGSKKTNHVTNNLWKILSSE